MRTINRTLPPRETRQATVGSGSTGSSMQCEEDEDVLIHLRCHLYKVHVVELEKMVKQPMTILVNIIKVTRYTVKEIRRNIGDM